MINRYNPIWAFCAKMLKNSDITQNIYNKLLLLFNKRYFLKEVAKRKELSIFDYELLAAPLPFCPIERIADANFYGYADSIKQYAGIDAQDYSLEHGLYYDDYIPRASYWKSVKRILTINAERKELIKVKLGKPVYSIGPYIHYADSLLSEDRIRKIKQEFGRILLVFPSHSNVEEKAIFNQNAFINNIKQFANTNKFETVFVNLFYHDILHSQYSKAYEDAGFKVVTSGHRYDLNFVRRLKSLISICDYTIGNSVGTHIGYCVYMGKAHYIIDDYKISLTSSKQYHEIYRPFSRFSDTITSEQYDVVSRYWGFDCIKSKEEMLEILQHES